MLSELPEILGILSHPAILPHLGLLGDLTHFLGNGVHWRGIATDRFSKTGGSYIGRPYLVDA